MSTSAQPLFDMSKAQPIAPESQPQTTPLFDMSKAQSISVPQQANPASEAQMFAATTGGQVGPAPTSTPMQTVPAPGNIGSRAWQAVKDEAGNIVQGAVAPIKMAAAPPTTAREHAIVAIGGPGALAAYRAAGKINDTAENVFKAKRENFQQAAADLQTAVREFHDKDYRQALADTASVVSDVGSLTGEPIHEMGRTREIAQGTKEGGDVITPLTKNVVDVGAALLAEKAPEIGKTVGKGVERVSEAAGEAAGKINQMEVRPEALVKRPDTPLPQHGTPVTVESPLDGPTVGSKLGGKDLSAEALAKLNEHVGDKIPVGGSAKNQLTAAVEPTVKAINETASKMNQVVKDAPDFTTSVAQEGKLTGEIDALKKNLPPSVRGSLGQDVDAVMEDSSKALTSTNPAGVLEERRKLGNQIDWDKIEKNPTTPAEIQNTARVKVYRALGNKIHEIPGTVALDKELAPNLELRSHMRSKLGDRVVDDPHAATVEAQSELEKGKAVIENAAHNEQVAKNWSRIKAALIAAGIGGGVVHEISSLFGL
jgi:hypothetical protein